MDDILSSFRTPSRTKIIIKQWGDFQQTVITRIPFPSLWNFPNLRFPQTTVSPPIRCINIPSMKTFQLLKNPCFFISRTHYIRGIAALQGCPWWQSHLPCNWPLGGGSYLQGLQTQTLCSDPCHWDETVSHFSLPIEIEPEKTFYGIEYSVRDLESHMRKAHGTQKPQSARLSNSDSRLAFSSHSYICIDWGTREHF